MPWCHVVYKMNRVSMNIALSIALSWMSRMCVSSKSTALYANYYVTSICSYMITQMLRKRGRERKTKQHNTTQHNTRPETTSLRWDLNSRFTHSRPDALPTELSKSPIQTHAKHSKAKRASERDKQARVIKPSRTSNSILSDIHEYSHTQKDRKQDKATQHNTTQHKT